MRMIRLLPVFFILTFLFAACSSEPAPPPVPLIERNKEVREYMAVLAELVDEYCTLVETTLDKAEMMKDMGSADGGTAFFESLDMISGVATSALRIKELSEEIEGMEAQKADFEKKLSAEDFQEFLGLYTHTLKRFYDIAKKAEELSTK